MVVDERRENERLEIRLPLQVVASNGELVDFELIDMSSDGLRVKGDALSIFSHDGDGKQVCFELRISAKLAWIEPQEDGTFELGLKLHEK
jgi:hypothetical protein